MENPPAVPVLEKITRTIMADHPRVTKYNIDFDDKPAPLPEPVQGGDAENDCMDMDMMQDDDEHEEEDEEDDDDVSLEGDDEASAHAVLNAAPGMPSHVQPSA